MEHRVIFLLFHSKTCQSLKQKIKKLPGITYKTEQLIFLSTTEVQSLSRVEKGLGESFGKSEL
jgi:hypothetical protein